MIFVSCGRFGRLGWTPAGSRPGNDSLASAAPSAPSRPSHLSQPLRANDRINTVHSGPIAPSSWAGRGGAGQRGRRGRGRGRGRGGVVQYRLLGGVAPTADAPRRQSADGSFRRRSGPDSTAGDGSDWLSAKQGGEMWDRASGQS